MVHIKKKKKKLHFREFPGGPGFRTQRFHGLGQGSIPGWGTKILQTVQCGQKIRKKKQNINANFKKELHFKQKTDGLEAEGKEEIHCANSNKRCITILISDERDFKKKRILIDLFY